MKVTKTICVSLSVCLLLSLAFINSGLAQTKPTIKVERVSGVEPAVFTGRAGGSFNLKLNIYDVGRYGVEDTDVYAWQVMMAWDNALLEFDAITFGDFMDTPRIGSWGDLMYNAPAGQNRVNVTTGSFYINPGIWGGTVLIQDDSNSETNTVTSQDGNMLTLQNNLAHSYTVAANGGAYPWPDVTSVATPGPAGNRIMVGQTTKGAPPGVQGGSGLLCTLTFNVLAEGETALDINAPSMGETQTYITNTFKEVLGDEPGEINKESGEFILPWDEDFDGDGSVAIFDLSSVALKYGETGTPGWIPEDINKDGDVDIIDLSLVSTAFGTYANV